MNDTKPRRGNTHVCVFTSWVFRCVSILFQGNFCCECVNLPAPLPSRPPSPLGGFPVWGQCFYGDGGAERLSLGTRDTDEEESELWTSERRHVTFK